MSSLTAKEEFLRQQRQVEGVDVSFTFTFNDPNTKLVVYVDEHTARMAADYQEGLFVMRSIALQGELQEASPEVIALAQRRWELRDEEDLPEFMQDASDDQLDLKWALNILRSDAQMRAKSAMLEGFLVALIDGGTLVHTDAEGNTKEYPEAFFHTMKRGKVDVVFVHNLIEHDAIPRDYFKFKPSVIEYRKKNYLPPLLERDPFAEMEQKLALIDMVKQSHADFRMAIETFFSQYLDVLISRVQDLVTTGGAPTSDGSGFLAGRVDTDTHATAKPVKSKGRGTRAASRALRAGNEGDESG